MKTLNVGDNVRVVEKFLSDHDYEGVYTCQEMLAYCGNAAIITEKHVDARGVEGYLIDIDGGAWTWTRALFHVPC